jgi:hypothetical protein
VGEVLTELGDRFTIPAFAEALDGAPVGAVRLSYGLGSIAADVDRTLEVLEEVARIG